MKKLIFNIILGIIPLCSYAQEGGTDLSSTSKIIQYAVDPGNMIGKIERLEQFFFADGLENHKCFYKALEIEQEMVDNDWMWAIEEMKKVSNGILRVANTDLWDSWSRNEMKKRFGALKEKWKKGCIIRISSEPL